MMFADPGMDLEEELLPWFVGMHFMRTPDGLRL